MQLRINESTSTTLKWATESNFLINCWVPAEGLCVHSTFLETLKEAVNLEVGLDFVGTIVRSVHWKGKKTIWGVFVRGLCSRFHPRIDKTTKTVPKTVSLLLVVAVVVVIIFASQAENGGGLATTVTACFHSKEPERKKPEESRRALTSVAQLVGHSPAKQGVTGSIPFPVRAHAWVTGSVPGGST